MPFLMRDYLPHIIIGCYILLVAVVSFLRVDSNFYGLSTFDIIYFSTNFLGTMVLNTTALNASQLAAIFGDKLFPSTLVITLFTIATVIYVELSDPSYGSTRKIIEEVRRSWLTPTLVLGILFSLIVFFKMLNPTV